jgi:tetratricopeptide (TPR) repeat protein
VKGVVVKLDDLTNHIKADQKSRVKIEEPLSINVFTASDNPDQSTTGLNGHFVHSLLLIDVLIRMKSIETDKQQLITLCKNEYKKNDTELALVCEFEHEYTSKKALWWYTRDSFLYRMLNKALRVQNIDLLFLFRFVISDIYHQLKQNQCKSSIRVYRGQVMSSDELDILRQSINELISINSFFSTSIDRHKAVGFLNGSGIINGLHRVLFVIDADPRVVTSKPCADISSLSDFCNECEVLFMIGCVFRLVDIRRDDHGQIWIIQMKLCGDDEHGLKKLFDHMKKEYAGGDDEVNLRSFGNVLRRMGKYDLAEKMYCRLLNELPPNDSSLSALYYSLGSVTKDKGDYDSSLQWFHKSLEIKMRSDPVDLVDIADIYNAIGECHRLKDDNNTALEYYEKGMKLYQQSNNENDPSMANFYNNIAIIYRKQKKYTQALDFYEKTLSIEEKHLPPDHSNIGDSHYNIGIVHYFLRQFEQAMECYHRSLKIRLKSLPAQHPSTARNYRSIGAVHEAKREWKQALTYYEKAATIYRHSLPPQHPSVIEIEKDIEDVLSKLKS